MSVDIAGIVLGFFVVILTIVLLALVRKRNRNDQKLTAGDILQLLKDTKQIRLDGCADWSLYEIIDHQRVWCSQLGCHDENLLKQPITVYGCFNRVKASAQDVLATLSSSSKYVEWDPDFRDIRVISPPQESKDPAAVKSQKSAQLAPVKHDIISGRSHFVANSMIQLVNTVTHFLQGQPLVQKRKTLYRVWHREENGCCWILEHEDETQEWTFYLAQSIDGWFGKDQCLLTIICHPHHLRGASGPARASYKMNALDNLFLHHKIKCAPLLFITLPTAHSTEDISVSSTELSDSVQLSETENVQEAKSELKAAKSEPNFLQKFKKMVEEKKEQYEREKSLKKKRMEALAAAQKETIKDILHHDVDAEVNPPSLVNINMDAREEVASIESKDLPLQPLESSDNEDERDGLITNSSSSTEEIYKEKKAGIMRLFTNGKKANGDSSSAVESSPVPSGMQQWGDSVKRRLRKELSKMSRSLENSVELSGNETPLTGRSNSLKSIPDDVSEEEPTFNSPLLEKKTTKNPLENHSEVVEEVNISPEVSSAPAQTEKMSAFTSQASLIIEEILTEKSRISQININLPPEAQAARTGGWIYCTLDRDIVVLKKVVDENLTSPVYSFLGKGIIECHPTQVFEKLCNPQTRFTYDEMIKKVDVLEDLGNGMKIVYLCHEVAQIFKRESHDFCLIQCERHRGSEAGLQKYAIGIESVKWSSCPENEDIVRSKLLPSGWIIEPILKGDQVFSMVTYIVRIEATGGRGAAALEDLASKQPYAISMLREFLTPPTPQMLPLKVLPNHSPALKAPVPKSDKEDGEVKREAPALQPDVLC